MTNTDPYETLGLRPDASHHEVMNAFARLARKYRSEMSSDPAAKERLQQVMGAYETLTDYETRLRYNIERGLPDPPRPGKCGEPGGLLEGIGGIVPEDWPVLLPWLSLILGGNLAYYLLTGRLPWGFVWASASSDADRLIFVVAVLLFVTLARLVSGKD